MKKGIVLLAILFGLALGNVSLSHALEMEAGVAIEPEESGFIMVQVPGEPGYYLIEEPITDEIKEEETAVEAIIVPTFPNRWGILLTDAERDILARIVMLEAGGESDLGQQAVIEVILNRVCNDYYPNNVTDVLSHKDGKYRQFSTWGKRNSAEANPSERLLRNMDLVLMGKTEILPFETVYFSRKGQNKRVQTRIGGHVFCNQ